MTIRTHTTEPSTFCRMFSGVWAEKSCRLLGHANRKRRLSVESDAFLMDFENACLANHWNPCVPHPTGDRRYEHTEWAAMIQRQVFPHHSDVDWEEYCNWVKNGRAMSGFRKRRPI